MSTESASTPPSVGNDSSSNLFAEVVIVGSGAVGAMAAYKLASAGVKVLILEAGTEVRRFDAVKRFQESHDKGPNSAFEQLPWAPHPEPHRPGAYILDDGEGMDRFIGTYARCVGGTTWHFTGFATRLRPEDFELRARYGVGVDWPVSYRDLEPWYEEAEKEWGVAGFQGQDMGGPRSIPYPQSGIPLTYLDRAVAEAVSPLGLTVESFPQARNSVVYDSRPPCCGSASCVPICPIGAKYDGAVHVSKAVAAGARVINPAVATEIEIDASRRVSGIRFRRPDGSEGRATGRTYIVAAHAIETPKLLLISRSEWAPRGVANFSDQVGRNLMSQVSLDTRALTADPIFPYRGPITTAGIVELREGPFRARHAAIGTSVLNRGWSIGTGPLELARHLAGRRLRGDALKAELDRQVSRHLYIDTAVEMLPDPENRIVPDFDRRDALGIPRPRVRCHVDDYTRAGVEVARARHDAMVKALRCSEIFTEPVSQSVAIIAGTTRMGTDPKTSVIGPDQRTHDHPNLYLLGLGGFPTAPINPPTLTAAALAIRAAKQIREELSA